MKKIVTSATKKLVRLAGFQVTNVIRLDFPIPHLPVQAPGQTTRIVELVGPSGVGKSTFLHYLRFTNSRGDEYATLRYSRRLSRISRVTKHLLQQNEAWRTLWQLQFSNDSASVMSNGKPWTYQNELGLQSIVSNVPIIIDHSLLYFFRKSLLSLHGSHPGLFHSLMLNRYAVLCIVEPAVLVGRIQRRTSEGFTRDFHSGKTDDELLTFVTKDLFEWTEYGNWLESVGIPILNLDVCNHPEESKRILKTFIANLE